MLQHFGMIIDIHKKLLYLPEVKASRISNLATDMVKVKIAQLFYLDCLKDQMISCTGRALWATYM